MHAYIQKHKVIHINLYDEDTRKICINIKKLQINCKLIQLTMFDLDGSVGYGNYLPRNINRFSQNLKIYKQKY